VGVALGPDADTHTVAVHNAVHNAVGIGLGLGVRARIAVGASVGDGDDDRYALTASGPESGSKRMTTDFEVGVLLVSAVLSSGTSTLVSG
jgi:hypothetical protein